MSPSEFETKAGQTRDVTINIRAQQNQRDLIDHAAQIKGKSRSEFMLEAAYEKAQNILLDQCFFGLNEVQFQEFLDRLDAPPNPNHQLQQLLTTQSPWD